MSIATLKKKTFAQNDSMSHGYTNFSLNGTRRNQGYIGQTMLSRSLPRTPMGGNTPKGYGGCCGTYRITPIIQSAVSSTEDNTIIKPSVMNTHGLIQTKYRWIRRPQPFSVTKPDNNNHFFYQSNHISIVNQNTLACIKKIDDDTPDSKIGKPSNMHCFKITDVQVPLPCNNITKSNTFTGSIDQGTYIQQMDSGCAVYNVIYPSNTQNMVFGCQ
jgi:hypothetical protein